jgi:hypothetical protein
MGIVRLGGREMVRLPTDARIVTTALWKCRHRGLVHQLAFEPNSNPDSCDGHQHHQIAGRFGQTLRIVVESIGLTPSRDWNGQAFSFAHHP